MDVRVVLFDLDGVLLDSTPVHRRLWERWAVRHRLDPEQVFAATFGRRPAEAIGAVAPWLVVPEELLWLDELLRRERDMFALMPGAAAAVAAARQFAAWGVVTSSSAEHATYCLTRHGIPAPIVLVGGTDTAEGKPSPAPYLLASVRAGVPSAACVAVWRTPPPASPRPGRLVRLRSLLPARMPQASLRPPTGALPLWMTSHNSCLPSAGKAMLQVRRKLHSRAWKGGPAAADAADMPEWQAELRGGNPARRPHIDTARAE